jgi:hypothetical protein
VSFVILSAWCWAGLLGHPLLYQVCGARLCCVLGNFVCLVLGWVAGPSAEHGAWCVGLQLHAFSLSWSIVLCCMVFADCRKASSSTSKTI